MASDICPLCDNKSNKTFWICCDFCDVWHHGSCVGLTKKAVEKLNTWHCRKCVSEKAMSNNVTAHETLPKAAVVPPIKTANYFLTVCVCNNGLMCNTTTSNIRVSAQCGVCHNHFHVHCIRVKASNGTVLCPNCSCQNNDDVDQIQETVDTHETTNISTVALATQPRPEAVATTLLASALPTQLGSEEITVSAVPSTPLIPSESEKTSVSAVPSPTPPTHSSSEERTVAIPSLPPTYPGSEETTVSAVPFPSSSGSNVTNFSVVSPIPVCQSHGSAVKNENNDGLLAEFEGAVRMPCALRFTSPFPPTKTIVKRKSLSLSKNKILKLSASQP